MTPLAQRITYAKGKSHATVLQEEGPEALFRLKQGIFDSKTPKLTVSGAEKANIDAEKAKAASAKREREALEAGESDDDEEAAKRPKINGTAAAAADEDDEAGAYRAAYQRVTCVLMRRAQPWRKTLTTSRHPRQRPPCPMATYPPMPFLPIRRAMSCMSLGSPLR
jgi:hypothetical protein